MVNNFQEVNKMLKNGDKAPEINLTDSEGENIKLSNFFGKRVLVYFYPRDNTPGCIKEACVFRDIYDQILDKDIVLIGISPDNQKSHKNFKDKYNLPFYLLSDVDKKVSTSYGVIGEKKIFGKISFGIKRTTFIIDENGYIEKIFPKVSPAKHGDEILKYLK
jgi:peroxiredoxin Q/BCP